MQPTQLLLPFKRITAAEAQTDRAQIAVRFAEAAPLPRPPPPLPRPVGRPSLKRELLERDATTDLESKQKKARGMYTTWFSSPYINDILAAYRHSAYRARVAVADLRRLAPDDRYDRLSHSTIISWFDADNQLLPHFAAQLENAERERHAGGRVRALHQHPAVEDELKSVLLRMREAGAPIGIAVVRWVMQAVLEKRAAHLLSSLQLSDSFISRWVREQLEWRWRASTTAASKLPADWEDQGIMMAKRIAANMEMYKVRDTVHSYCVPPAAIPPLSLIQSLS